jgi:protein transport protein HofB
MKTDRLISLCQRHQALLLNSDEQTIAIAVVDAPTPELMEALRFATQKANRYRMLEPGADG